LLKILRIVLLKADRFERRFFGLRQVVALIEQFAQLEVSEAVEGVFRNALPERFQSQVESALEGVDLPSIQIQTQVVGKSLLHHVQRSQSVVEPLRTVVSVNEQPQPRGLEFSGRAGFLKVRQRLVRVGFLFQAREDVRLKDQILRV